MTTDRHKQKGKLYHIAVKLELEQRISTRLAVVTKTSGAKSNACLLRMNKLKPFSPHL